ncbi:MAG: hypothetical protein JNL67_14615 [Planctomycetaceae bacterium]|nr:hypothetical protein [Planctomycetaceae bacterium]
MFVSTHSPQFLNAVPLGSLYHIEKLNGLSRVIAIADDPLISAQVIGGERPGYLWDQGLFVGVTQRAQLR